MTGQGAGVSSYASTLYAAARSSGAIPELLSATTGASIGMGRVHRLATAVLHHSMVVSADGSGVLTARDVFQIAHVHLSLHRSLLRLRAPGLPVIMHWENIPYR